jgi:hypothetical protein
MPTFIQIGSAVVVGSSGQAAIDFTSIPSTYTDLQLLLSLRSASGSNLGAVGINLTINGSTANRTQRRIFADGTNVGSDSSTNNAIRAVLPTSTSTASTFGNLSLYFPNYSGSTNKSFSVDNVAENNSATINALEMTAGLWSITSAITSLSFTLGDASNFSQHSTAYLYGVSNA